MRIVFAGVSLYLLMAFAPPPQKMFVECVSDPEKYLAMDWKNFDQGVKPVEGGPRQEWGWREIAEVAGCETATADLISQWRQRNSGTLDEKTRLFMALHEGQIRASGGDYARAIELIEEGRMSFNTPHGQAYVDAMVAFLRNDRDGLMAARERLLAVPEPANWARTQQLFREQAGQEMRWPLNIEATDKLVACFGKGYPGGVNGTCS